MPHSEELDNREVLAVHQLNIAFQEERQFIPAVQNLSFTLRRGETLAIVGESGSGKSVTALALMRLLEQTGGQISSEKMLLRRRNRQVIDLNELSGAQMQGVRGADIAMIFQEPMTSLNPVFPVGEQIAESIRLHQGLSGDEALNEALRTEAARIATAVPGARLACVNVLKTNVIGVDELVDDDGNSLHVKHLVELKNWANEMKLPADRVTFHVLESSDPSEALQVFARNNHVDHMIVGARGSGGVRRFMGSVSTALVAQTTCTVTVVRVSHHEHEHHEEDA